jgi:hypothetical protein
MLIALSLLGVVLGGDEADGFKAKTVTLSVGGSGIQFVSKEKTDIENEIKIFVHQVDSNGNGERLEAKIESYTKVFKTSAKVKFRAKFKYLVEYLEDDGVAGYSDNDTVGVQINLGEEDFDYDQQLDQGDPANPIKVATATSQYLTLTCKVGSNIFNDSGVWAFTNGVKIDVDIANFPYSLGGNARLALVMGFISLKTKFKTKESDDSQTTVQSEKISVKSDGVVGPSDAYFSWAETVDITSPAGTADVIVSTIHLVNNDGDDGDDNDHRNLVYSFDALHPDTIHWDPFFGLNGSSHLWPCSLLSAFLLAVLALLQ